MSLPAGTKLGPYQVSSKLGEGGMGEVYRAHDSRLDREVAIKVLPEIVAADRDRIARFEQEARATAGRSRAAALAARARTDRGLLAGPKGAARLLGMSRSTAWSRMPKLGITPSEGVSPGSVTGRTRD